MYHEMEESQMRIAIANSLEEVSGSSLSYKRPRSASSNLPASSAEHKRNRDMMMLEKFEEVAENSADEDDDITWV